MDFALVPSFPTRNKIATVSASPTWISWFERGGRILPSLTAHDHVPKLPAGPTVLETLVKPP